MIFTDSTPLLKDAQALRARAHGDGYLFFKGLLPAEGVLPLRADLLRVVGRHGWRRDGIGDLDGALNLEALSRVPQSEMRLDIGVSLAAYDDAQKLESAHRLPHHPRLLELYRTLFGGEVFVHPRHVMRMITPHPAMAPTPPHQDFPLIQGTPNTWTCWFPIGDCPRELGALSVLRGSHHLGHVPVVAAKGAGGIASHLCPHEKKECEWIEGDFAAGDVLTFPSYTVHRALPCRFKNQIRLSFDVRYQPLGEVVEAGSLRPHCELSWDEIYADWEQDDLKFYWHDLPLRYAPWDGSQMQPSRRIC